MEEVLQRLARIETKLANELAGHTDHEGRLRSIEGWKHRVMGYSLAVSAVAAVVVTKLLSLVSISLPAVLEGAP